MDISVKYYNEAERRLFQAYPKVAVLNRLTSNTVSIEKGDLLAYMMFTEQGNFPGRRTYADLSARIQQRLGDFDDHFTFNNGSIQARYIGNDMVGDFTERLGVGLGLCIIDKIEGLTQADWQYIPTVAGPNGYPTFDYEYHLASTGSNFIQVENKGSTVDDNDYKRPSVSILYADIKRKKRSIRADETHRGIAIHHNTYYGTIAVLDNRTNSVARVWLIDPPAFNFEMDPYKYKLLTRLKYYLEEFRNIGVKEAIVSPLERRIEDIQRSSDYMSYNNVRIDYVSPKGIERFLDGKMFAAVDTNEAFGRIFTVERNRRNIPYLVAFPKALIRIIIEQDFDKVVNYQYDPDFINERVQVLILVGIKEIEEFKLPDNIHFVFNERRKIYEGTYFGKVSHDKSGRIFGLLDQEQELRK